MPASSEFAYQGGRFTGTSANVVMNGGEAEWNRHYLIRSGQIEPDPPTWAMRAGSHMESLILDWFEEQSAHPITRRGEVVFHPDIADVCCKLDGYCAALDAIIEVKFLSPHWQREDFNRAYFAQTTLQRICTGAEKAILLVAQGTAAPIDFEHDHDPEYAAELLRRAAIFLGCLRSLTPPYPMPPAPPPREKWRTIDIIAEPTNWASELLLYLQSYADTAAAAALHDEMGRAARALVPDDIAKCHAGDFVISRNRRGVLSITTTKGG